MRLTSVPTSCVTSPTSVMTNLAISVFRTSATLALDGPMMSRLLTYSVSMVYMLPLPFVQSQGSEAVDVKPIVFKSLSMVLFQTLEDYRRPYKLMRSIITIGRLVAFCIFSKPGACLVFTSYCSFPLRIAFARPKIVRGNPAML